MNARRFVRRGLLIVGGLLGMIIVSQIFAASEPHVHRGYGPCKHRTCSCYQFDGKGTTCKCGHSFYDHR